MERAGVLKSIDHGERVFFSFSCVSLTELHTCQLQYNGPRWMPFIHSLPVSLPGHHGWWECSRVCLPLMWSMTEACSIVRRVLPPPPTLNSLCEIAPHKSGYSHFSCSKERVCRETEYGLRNYLAHSLNFFRMSLSVCMKLCPSYKGFQCHKQHMEACLETNLKLFATEE